MRTLYGHELVTRAMCIAFDAHLGVYRADRTPYVDHPRRVAGMLADVGHRPDVVAAALLHDVVEDSCWTLDDLADEGFPSAVVDAVDSVTKRADETYFDAVTRAALARSPDSSNSPARPRFPTVDPGCANPARLGDDRTSAIGLGLREGACSR